MTHPIGLSRWFSVVTCRKLEDKINRSYCHYDGSAIYRLYVYLYAYIYEMESDTIDIDILIS